MSRRGSCPAPQPQALASLSVIDALESLLATNVLEGLTTRPIEELRALRQRATAAESDVSLTRRIVQGRIDIVGHEIRRRSGDTAAEAALPGLLFDLPSLMTGEPRSPSGPVGGRAVSITAPGEVAAELVDRLDSVASPGLLTGIASLPDDQVTSLLEQMRALEQELSGIRRRLHEQIDTVQAEIGRRYRDGETSVDRVLG